MNDLVVELDPHRGVLYVHSPKGYTVLRICGLPHDLAERVRKVCESNVAEMVDVTVTAWMSS